MTSEWQEPTSSSSPSITIDPSVSPVPETGKQAWETPHVTAAAIKDITAENDDSAGS
jgi:hypothetical protein